MSSITIQSNYVNPTLERKQASTISRFLSWIKEEEKNRIAWVGISIIVMTAIFFPLTMAAILFKGAGFKLIIVAMISLILVVIPNLAALPTKYTIPAFLTGVIMDIALMVISFII